MKAKTLIVLTPAFPADESEAESTWLPAKQRLIKCINRNYPETEIIILSFQFPKTKKQYYWNKNLVIPFAGGNNNNKKNWLVWFNVFRTLRKLNKEKNIIGLLSFWCAECAFVAHYFSKYYKTRHLCWISGQDAKKENKFVKRIKPKSAELVAMSDFLMDEFEKNHHIRPAYLITNGIDTNQFTLGSFVRDIDIIGVGSLSTLKQFDLFVRIISSLKVYFPNIKAIICGDGIERKNIEKQITDNQLEQNIVLLGWVSQMRAFELMQQSKILLHTSSYEGFGNIFIEALYAGAHVVSLVKPIKKHISHWHFAETKNEIISTLFSLLENERLDHCSVLPFEMNESAKAFMEIFLSEKQD